MSEPLADWKPELLGVDGRVLPVVSAPAPVLSAPGVDVDPVDPDIVQLAADLIATMRVSPGCVGLAAPQIGVGARVFSVDVTQHPKTVTTHGTFVLCNAKIVEASRWRPGREGCMSVPDLTGDVKRAGRVVVEALLPGTGEPGSRPPTRSRRARCSTRSTTARASCSWIGWPAPTPSTNAGCISNDP